MSAPGRDELARRLFGSARRQRASPELRARILAAGREELERGHVEQGHLPRRGGGSALDAQRSSEEASDSLGSARRARGRATGAHRWVAVGALAAAAAGLFVFMGLSSAPEPGVLISAERTGAAASARESNEGKPEEHPTLAPAVPQAAQGVETPSVAERAGPPTSEAASGSPDASPRKAASASRQPASESERAAAPFDAKPTNAHPVNSTPTPDRTLARAKPERTPPLREARRASLGQQLEQIKAARAALRAGDHQRAFELLDAYRAQPGGAELAAEASLLRIEALAASGQREAAAQAARQFASDYPNSPLIDRALSYASSGTER